MTDAGEKVTINIIDTPGHADFGGEVERGLEMVDGVLLLVDASEGPLPQTRFVLRKALAKDLPIIVVINKVDRHDARIKEVIDETYALFMDLVEDDQAHILDFPIVYAPRRPAAPRSTCPRTAPTRLREPPAAVRDDLQHHPGTRVHRGRGPAGARDQPRREPVPRPLALCRIIAGTMTRGQTVAWCKHDGTVQNVRLTELLMTRALTREPADSAGPGDIVAIAGIPEITIGETLSDPTTRSRCR